MTITIIGSGKVGASAALNCGLRELGDVVLLDVVQGLPQGEAMDINHQLSERGIDSFIRGSNDYQDMHGSNVGERNEHCPARPPGLPSKAPKKTHAAGSAPNAVTTCAVDMNTARSAAHPGSQGRRTPPRKRRGSSSSPWAR